MENPRQFIPRAPGHQQLTDSEKKYGKTGNNSSLKKATRALALGATIALSAGSAYSQTPDQDRQNMEQKEESPIKKYQRWLVDMSEDDSRLTGSKIKESSKKDDETKSYTISLSDGRKLEIETDGDADFTLKTFQGTINSALRHLNEVKRQMVTEEMAQGWLDELAVSEPDLKGSSLYIDGKASGFMGGGFYVISSPDSKFLCSFKLYPDQNNKEGFRREIQKFLGRRK